MDSQGPEVDIKVQVKFRAGRDDRVIQALAGVNPKYRAEQVRRMVTMYLSGHKPDVAPEASGTLTQRREPVAASSEPSVPGAEKRTATGEGLDLSQLDGLSIEMDFLTIGGGGT